MLFGQKKSFGYVNLGFGETAIVRFLYILGVKPSNSENAWKIIQ